MRRTKPKTMTAFQAAERITEVRQTQDARIEKAEHDARAKLKSADADYIEALKRAVPEGEQSRLESLLDAAVEAAT